MADISESDRMLAADDSRLNDDQDLIPMAVPGIAGNDKGAAMTRTEFAKRLRDMLLNRVGERLDSDYDLTNSYASALSRQITPKKASSEISIRATFAAATLQFAYNMRIRRGNSITVWESKNIRSGESPENSGQGEPIVVYALDKPSTTNDVTYNLEFQGFRELLAIHSSTTPDRLVLIDRDSPGSSSIIDSFPSGYNDLEAMTSHGGELLAIDRSTNPDRLVLIDRNSPSSSSIIDSFPSGYNNLQAMTSHGGELLAIDRSINPNRLVLIDRDSPGSSSIIDSFPSGYNNLQAMTSHGGELLAIDSSTTPDRLVLIDRNSPSSSSIIDSFPSGYNNLQAMTSHGGELLAIDSTANPDRLVLIDRNSPGSSSIIDSFPSGYNVLLAMTSHGVENQMISKGTNIVLEEL